jgi:hypothetical protein
MGVVVPFPGKLQRETIGPDAVEQAVVDAIGTGADRATLVMAAGPLLARCRDRYGFVVLRDELPPDDAALAESLLTLSWALKRLDPIIGGHLPTWVFGVRFCGSRLAWISEDGTTLIDVPFSTDPAALAGFVSERVRAAVA